MPPNFEMVHRVSIIFKPDGDEKFSTEEIISFSKEQTAKEFAARQLKKSQVMSARYIGGNEK